MSAEPTAPAVVRRAAAEYGDRPLLVLPDAQLTFREAEAASRRLARRLLAAGVGKGTRVALHFGYSAEHLVALLAVARIGALAAPLSTAYAPAELGAALRRCDAHLLLVADRLHGRDELALLAEAVPELAGHEAPELLLCASLPFLRQIWVLGLRPSSAPWAASIDLADGDDADGVGDDLLEQAEAEVAPADLLVLIQTSGSTADPKGVLHTHGAVFRKTAGSYVPTGPIYLAMPFFWVGGLITLCTALQTGTTVVCQERFEVEQALDLIEQHRVAIVAAWFTVTQALRTHPSVPDRDLSCIPMLTVPAAAAPYATPLGMTETLGPHTGIPHPDHGMAPPEHLRGSNGITPPDVEHRLVDPDTGKPVEGDGVGEICVRGRIVTVGMYKREREDVFDPDGWYRTGDLVERRDGLWWFVGRTTEMIKARGANVAPPEVEAVLETLPGVQHAVVFGLPRPDHDEIVAAVVVPQDGADIDLDRIRSEAAERLSRFKVPSVILAMTEDDVPWLATGKPDKRRLRALLEARGT